MKAVILCGGRGRRLGDLTKDKPKGMVKLCEKPMLEWIIETCKDIAIDEVVFSVAYKKDKIIDYFGNGSKFGIAASYLEQSSPAGPDSAVTQAGTFLNEPFLCLNNDSILTAAQFKYILGEYTRKQADGIFVLENDHLEKRIRVDIDREGILESADWPNGFVLTSIGIFTPNLIKKLTAESTSFAKVIPTLSMKTYGIHIGECSNVNFPEDIRPAESFIQKYLIPRNVERP